MREHGLRCAIAAALATACTVSNDDNPFGSGPVTSATVATSVGSTGDDESDDESSSSGESTSAGSTSAGETSTGGDTSSSTAAEPMTTTGPIDPTGQPADGMYSMCTAAADCGNLPIFCITNEGATDGFCSEIGCADANADCDPAPGGTATPICVGPLDIDGNDEMACALSCAGGLECPDGMACTDFTDLGMICM